MNKDIAIGILLGLVIGFIINFGYRWSFVRKLKQEPLDVQAQYKINRIKSLLETYAE